MDFLGCKLVRLLCRVFQRIREWFSVDKKSQPGGWPSSNKSMTSDQTFLLQKLWFVGFFGRDDVEPYWNLHRGMSFSHLNFGLHNLELFFWYACLSLMPFTPDIWPIFQPVIFFREKTPRLILRTGLVPTEKVTTYYTKWWRKRLIYHGKKYIQKTPPRIPGHIIFWRCFRV